jgi:hypothetical protein
MKFNILFWIGVLILICIGIVMNTFGWIEGFFDYVIVPAWRRGWGRRWPHGGWGRYGWGHRWGYDPRVNYVTYAEPFANNESVKPDEKEDPIMSYPLNGPDEYIQNNSEQYHLLKDVLPPISHDAGTTCNVNSRNCRMTDFGKLLEPTGNFRQMTNNYKHGYPDSCLSPFQEFILSFYKGDGMKVNVPDNCN